MSQTRIYPTHLHKVKAHSNIIGTKNVDQQKEVDKKYIYYLQNHMNLPTQPPIIYIKTSR